MTSPAMPSVEAVRGDAVVETSKKLMAVVKGVTEALLQDHNVLVVDIGSSAFEKEELERLRKLVLTVADLDTGKQIEWLTVAAQMAAVMEADQFVIVSTPGRALKTTEYDPFVKAVSAAVTKWAEENPDGGAHPAPEGNQHRDLD